MKRTAFFALCIFALSGCTETIDFEYSDELPTVVSGKVLDASSNKPLTDTKVYLMIQPALQPTTGSPSALQMQVSGEDGSFSFNFNAIDGNKYYLSAENNDYYTDSSGYKIKPGNINDAALVHLESKGYIKLNLTKSSNQDVLTGLKMTHFVMSTAGIDKDTFVTTYVPAGKNYILSVDLIYNFGEKKKQKRIPVFVKPNKTFEVQVEY